MASKPFPGLECRKRGRDSKLPVPGRCVEGAQLSFLDPSDAFSPLKKNV